MSSIQPLLKEADFASALVKILNTLPHQGIDRCSDATARKIAELPHLEEALRLEGDAVKARKLQKTITATNELISAQQMHVAHDCFEIYKNAHAAPLPLVIGGSQLREHGAIEELKNFGVLSAGAPSLTPHLASQITNVTTGSIFCPKPWSLIRNDAFIFGAIQSAHTFYAAGLLRREDLFDDEAGHLKVLGREIAMLSLAGYTQVTPAALKATCGLTFVCTDPAKQSISLEELIVKVSKIKSAEALLEFIS